MALSNIGGGSAVGTGVVRIFILRQVCLEVVRPLSSPLRLAPTGSSCCQGLWYGWGCLLVLSVVALQLLPWDIVDLTFFVIRQNPEGLK